MCRRLSWPILADSGQARDAQNGGKMAELTAKMVPRWRQDGSKKALLGAILAHLGVLWRHVGSLVQSLSLFCLSHTLDWRQDAPT